MNSLDMGIGKEKRHNRLALTMPRAISEKKKLSRTESKNHKVMVKLEDGDLVKLRSLSSNTSIPITMLCRILLRQAVSRYSLEDDLDLNDFIKLLGDDPIVHLSDRQREIITMMARGSSNRDIAKALNISVQTVKNHVTSILRALRVNNRTQAVVVAMKSNII